jgi:hypothetical protein
MENQQALTSAELAQLWGAYMSASLSHSVLTYFLEKAEDEDIKQIIQEAHSSSQSSMQYIANIFEQEGKPLPVAFTDEDVNPNAPRLYTDNYFLQYINQLGMLGMTESTTAINMAIRKDIYQFFSDLHQTFNQLHKKTLSVLVEKGLLTAPPTIPTLDKADFVKKQNFLTGWLGERRPLLSQEIAMLYSNIQRNALGASTLVGFSQVAQSKEVRKYMLRGIDIAKKHVNIFSEFLDGSDVPVPMGADAMVTNSNETSPFSDKLMMFHTTGMIAQGIGFYGFSISTNTRRDIATAYTRLTAEILLYSEDGANIMIENGWLEEPPRMVDREELANTQNRKE